MSVVVEIPFNPGRPYTVDDLDATPDDGRRYEIVDGVLLVSPAPIVNHQRGLFELCVLLRDSCPPHLEALPGPLDVVFTHDRVFAPDILVLPRGLDVKRIVEPPHLIVEVRSPSTALIDINLKRAAYEEGRVPSYWILDPTAPSLTVFELRRRRYVEITTVRGEEEFRANIPFPVTIVPARLVAT